MIAADSHYNVTVNHFAVCVNGKTAVAVAVKSDAYIRAVFNNGFTEALHVSRTAVQVDICAVGLAVDSDKVSPKSVECQRCSLVCSAVCTVDNYLHAVKLYIGRGNNKIHIVVNSRITDFSCAYLLRIRTGDSVKLAVHVFLDLKFQLVTKLKALRVKEFDTVILNGVVGCTDNDARIRIIFSYKIGNSRCRYYAQANCVCAYRANARNKRRLQHITRNTGIHAHDYFSVMIGFLSQHISTCASKPVYKLGSQLCVCNTAHTVGTEIFTHC